MKRALIAQLVAIASDLLSAAAALDADDVETAVAHLEAAKAKIGAPVA